MFVPQRITFTITPPNTNIGIQRSFTMLESIEKQYLYKWKEEILQTASIASWDEPTTVGVVKASIASKYLHLIQHKMTLDEIWKAILEHKYPYSDNLKYLNKLANTQQNDFLTIKKYYNTIESICTRLGTCLGWNEDMRRIKCQEAFYNGLSKRCKLEMVRLNIKDCTSIY
ncbi:hypothetical protein DMUE_3283 [Dictyocoela muelleri]|nr:hypothetical protein DMUE_3283 [Dictyocoela muelleri]